MSSRNSLILAHLILAAAQALKSEVSRQITELKELSTKGLLAQRYAKFRKFGEWSEA
ncbi:hypothetical protein N8539_02415 [Akkermansiaceae bacterium]|nr:hypothetical protein [Akkermansiaceae bacterium]